MTRVYTETILWWSFDVRKEIEVAMTTIFSFQ
jgi:hypothetical protein